jgi:hypothetical protein
MIGVKHKQKVIVFLICIAFVTILFVTIYIFREKDVDYRLSVVANGKLEMLNESDLRYKFSHEVDHEYISSCSQLSNPTTLSTFKDIDFKVEFIPANNLSDLKTNFELPYYYTFAEFIYDQEDWLSLVGSDYSLTQFNDIEFIRYIIGAEGCNTFYYFRKIPDHGMLVVELDQVEELDGHIGLKEEYAIKLIQEFSSIEDVIVEKEERDEIFLDTLETIELYKGEEEIEIRE